VRNIEAKSQAGARGLLTEIHQRAKGLGGPNLGGADRFRFTLTHLEHEKMTARAVLFSIVAG
jgi:hypothetical protein